MHAVQECRSCTDRIQSWWACMLLQARRWRDRNGRCWRAIMEESEARCDAFRQVNGWLLAPPIKEVIPPLTALLAGPSSSLLAANRFPYLNYIILLPSCVHTNHAHGAALIENSPSGRASRSGRDGALARLAGLHVYNFIYLYPN